jgi:hypothetical protein
MLPCAVDILIVQFDCLPLWYSRLCDIFYSTFNPLAHSLLPAVRDHLSVAASGFGIRNDPHQTYRHWPLFLTTVYSAVTASLIAMLLVWKGGSYEVNLTDAQIPLVIVMVGVGFGLSVATFFIPWLYHTAVK